MDVIVFSQDHQEMIIRHCKGSCMLTTSVTQYNSIVMHCNCITLAGFEVTLPYHYFHLGMRIHQQLQHKIHILLTYLNTKTANSKIHWFCQSESLVTAHCLTRLIIG